MLICAWEIDWTAVTNTDIIDVPLIALAGPLKRRIVVALYNYTAREETDVSFVKGDRMEVMDDTESDWWRVVHMTTRQEGLIPWNFVAEEKSVNSEE